MGGLEEQWRAKADYWNVNTVDDGADADGPHAG